MPAGTGADAAMNAATTSARGRVRDALQENGIRLVAAKGLEKIAVADILTAANVSRRTFYGHFSNKYELVASIVNPTLDAGSVLLAELQRAQPAAILPGIVSCYLQLWENHGDALLAISGLDDGIIPYIADSHRKFGGELQALLQRAATAGLLLNDDAGLSFRVISRTAVPLLKIYGGIDNGPQLYRQAMLALLRKTAGADNDTSVKHRSDKHEPDY